MNKNCNKCNLLISEGQKPGVSCDGFCGNSYHLACVNLSADISKYKKQSGCLWFCERCLNLNKEEKLFKDMMHNSIQDILNKLDVAFSSMKKELIESINYKFNNIPDVSIPSFSEVVKKNKTSLIIKPINEEQTVSLTKSDVLVNIKNCDTNLPITKVKHINKGGILLSCNTDEENLKLKKVVDEKLSQNYKINEINNPKPRIKIVGISSEMSAAEVEKFLKLQNPDVIKEDSECKVMKIWQTRKRRDILQAIVQLDITAYKNIMFSDEKCVLVGLDRCLVYDGIEVVRCFKCSSFNHSSALCKGKLACPRCSLEHELTSCKDEYPEKCINCLNYKNLKLKSNENSYIDCNHSALDKNKCTIYKQKLTSLKSSIFGPQ